MENAGSHIHHEKALSVVLAECFVEPTLAFVPIVHLLLRTRGIFTHTTEAMGVTTKEDHMNGALRVAVLAALVAGIAGQALATDKVQVTPRVTKELITINLMNGLASDNKGVRENAAFMLGEQKITRAIVPLMKMLRDSEEESSRIVAALSLCRMGEPRGVYAVRMAAKFDNSEKVRTLCAWFYNQYVKPGSFEFTTVKPAEPLEYGGK
jgi:hypothetical protein